MRAIILSNNIYRLSKVFPKDIVNEICQRFNCDGRFLEKKDIVSGYDCKDVEAIFSTWGMPKFSPKEIRDFFPSLKYVFYAAGSVQDFARPFIDKGVRVFSSWQANAIPVAEYTFAHIILANKGYYKVSNRFSFRFIKSLHARKYTGNYRAKVGLLGVGEIGSLVAERLKTIDVEVYVYDAFLSDDRANKLNVKKVELEWLFANCNVISNHLANKTELNNLINYKLLKSMPKRATFINTGRGAQVKEWDLFRVLAFDKTKYAVLDVTKYEPIGLFNPLRLVRNKVITPHIAGSMGQEVVRMSRFMLDTSLKVVNGKKVDNEISLTMLDTMA